MLTTNQQRVLKKLKTNPAGIGHLLGFTKLTSLHNEWIYEMVFGKGDTTIQGHRGSYKTTAVSIAIAVIMCLYPNDKVMFMRKTDTDVEEIVAQVAKILESDVFRYLTKLLWGVEVELTKKRSNSLTTNLAGNDPRGTAQLLAIGCGSSITGKHFDRIFTDDIVNVTDRYSRAERERTKIAYQELQNIKNRGGRIVNTGTPWHEDDAFKLMPPAKRYDCYSTGLISAVELEKIRGGMTASLFSANYELRHIASDNIIFTNPRLHGDPAMAEQGVCHIDASYGGEDFTAFTICHKVEDTYYVLGKLWHKHVDDIEDEAIAIRKQFNAGRISCENNGDKGYLAKDLRSKGERTHVYHEKMNKHLKITSYLKNEWQNVVFVEGTDEAYITQVCDYTEDAEHDDAPDSLASIIRELWRKKPSDNSGRLDGYLM